MGSEHRTSDSKRWKTAYGFTIRDSEILAEAARLMQCMDDEVVQTLLNRAEKWRAEGR